MICEKTNQHEKNVRKYSKKLEKLVKINPDFLETEVLRCNNVESFDDILDISRKSNNSDQCFTFAETKSEETLSNYTL